MLRRNTTIGARERRRPMLLALVFGVFLMLIGLTAIALVTVTSMHLTNGTLDTVVGRDRSLVALFVEDNVHREDVDANGPTTASADELEKKLALLTAKDEILRVDIRANDGTILVSSTPNQRGIKPPVSKEMRQALDGTPFVSLVDKSAVTDLGSNPFNTAHLVREYLPLLSDTNKTLAVFAVWRDATPLLARIDLARRDVVLVTVAASLFLAAVLFGVFRAAQKRITRQQAQLLEAERRDPLTGLLNHGAVVGLLAEQLERVRGTGGRLGLALMDIDNFRLLNDTHGHDAADGVLVRVADLVERETGEHGQVARYGPDEFILVLADAGVPEVEAAVERVRHGLSEMSMQFGESEQLPVSISTGICLYPDHADSVTELLTAGAVAVREAKASGGDSVRVARVGDEAREASGSFDVLQGLVIAVDTKDRYTKRHSEDVARYAVFLARRMGIDAEQLQTIHLAGLLHDIGKIGIPDTLLRKPSRLTAQEFDIFKQHVALGDAIVRDVPDVEMVRAGIRHHHERWDGRGYLEGLERDEIPLLGRILAVADAFSAMTTTRPYRKAMDITEALKRLGDSAGTQLQEELVTLFIEGIETDADAPLPGEPQTGLWVPALKVA
jgi:diguanylate cyclase (GGDEF)-like protein/putative nucleotidyltransferase with HDIG domain